MRLTFLLVPCIVAGSASAQAQARYAFTERSILEVHGDTIHWLHRISETAVDTTVYVIRKDSSVRMLRPGPARDLPEEVGRQFRFLFAEAKESEALKARLEARRP